jgi:hypothetical protein
MKLRIPRLLGEINDKDTQFTALMKGNQELVFMGGALVSLMIIGFGVVTILNQAPTGTWRYGLCKTFLEKYSQYPTELKILTVAEKQNSAQLGYLTTNSYGSKESQLMECFFNISGQNITLNKVTIDRRNLVFPSSETGDDVKKEQFEDKQKLYQFIYTLKDKDKENFLGEKYPKVTLSEFNKTIPLILADEDLDLTMPRPLSNDITDLKFE